MLTGAIAKVVYSSAIEAVPDSIGFRKAFLDILSQFKFEGLSSLREAILDSIQQDFGDTEEAWDLKARAPSNDKTSTSQVSWQLLPGRAPFYALTAPFMLFCCIVGSRLSCPALHSMQLNSTLVPGWHASGMLQLS